MVLSKYNPLRDEIPIGESFFTLRFRWTYPLRMCSIILNNLRVARSTSSWAGAGGAELGQCAGEQVYMLEKCHRWEKLRRGNLHLIHIPISVFVQCMCGKIRSRGNRKRFLLTVAGEPLGLVDARRQRCEGKHVGVRDPLAHILLLQVWTLLQIIVINSPWENSARVNEAETERERQGGRKYCFVKQSIGQWINESCCNQ